MNSPLSIRLSLRLIAITSLAAVSVSSVRGDAVVPITFNGMIVNNTANNNFGSFTYNGADDTQAPQSLSPIQAFVYDSLNSSGGGLLNGSGAGFNGAQNTESPLDQLNGHVLDIHADDFPILDRGGFGLNFDPDLYKLEVVYRPLPTNEAPIFNVQFDTHDGFVDETRNVPGVYVPGVGKRSGEQHQWGFGYGEGANIQQLYDAGVKDADGFVTISTPLSDGAGGVGPDWTFTGPTFLFNSGDQNFQTLNTIQGEGAIDFGTFENLTPNGVGQIHLQSAFLEEDPAGSGSNPNQGRLHIEVKRISVVPINPDPTLVARYDSRAGVGRRFGSPFSTQTAPDGITLVDNTVTHQGNFYVIRETDQIQRYDETGFTNLVIQTDDDDTTGGFGIWQEPHYQTFNGADANLVISAKLIDLNPNAQEANTRADSFGIVLNDVDGDDSAAGLGGEEYRYNVMSADLNTSTFTQLTIPLSSLDRTAANEFTNDGDGSLEDFNLYYIGIVADQDAGLVGVEIEYIEVRLPSVALLGDYNNNGVVDAADYTVWRDTLGAGGSNLPNDPTPGTVDQSDYTYWTQHYGETLGASAATLATPEPSAAVLAMLLTALGLRPRGYRPRRSAE